MNNYDGILNNVPFEEQNAAFSKEEYAIRKKAERDEIFALSDNTALEVANNGGKFQQYLDVQSRFDRYSAVNALLILAQKPTATRLADFEHWKNWGGFVKPGQNAFSILEPHEYTKEDGTVGISYNIKKVFDISQVDARKVKVSPPPSYADRQLLSALISKAPMKISGTDELPDGVAAMTDPETGEITVRKGMEFADTFKGVVQEMGYYEADRDADKIPVNPSFVGYCTAYIICKKYGVDTKAFNFSKTPDVFRDLTPQEIKSQLAIIRDAVESIAGRMEKYLGAAQKAAKMQESR